jgi:hypothetical protein
MSEAQETMLQSIFKAIIELSQEDESNEKHNKPVDKEKKESVQYHWIKDVITHELAQEATPEGMYL